MATEYKSLSQLREISSINDEDMLLVSIFDNDRHIFQSGSMKWVDVKNRFVDQIKDRPEDWFMVPSLSSHQIMADRLSVSDGFVFSDSVLSGQLSVGIRYVPGYPDAKYGSGKLMLQNATGSISSEVDMDDVLAGMAQAGVIGSVSASPDNQFVVFQLQRPNTVGGGMTPTPLGPPISAVNGLYKFVDGLTVLTAENRTPSVALAWDAVYATFADGSRTMAVPELSAGQISAYGGVISGAVLDSVSAISLSAGGYDVGETLCSLVSGLSAANDKIRRTLSTHVASYTLSHDDDSALSDVLALSDFSDITWEDGDVFVLRKQVCAEDDPALSASGPFQHRAYVYAGQYADPQWTAMDGTYSADSVVFSDDLSMYGAYESIGNIKMSDYPDHVYRVRGKTVGEVFNDMFDRTIEPELGREPSLTNFTLSFDDPEVGRSGYFRFGIKYNSGTYLLPWNGEHVSTSAYVSVLIDTGTAYKAIEGTLSAMTSSWSNIQLPGDAVMIVDGTATTVSAMAAYGEGQAVKNNKGGPTDIVSPSGQTGWLSSNMVRGYRKYFWGAHQNCSADISCDNIDSLLSSTSTKAAARNDSFKIQIHQYDKRAAFAYPSSANVSGCKVIDDTQKVEITTAFTESRVQIGDAQTELVEGVTKRRHKNTIEYKLYQTNINIAGGGAAAANTYTVTFL